MIIYNKLNKFLLQNIALSQRATPSNVARFQALKDLMKKGQTFLFAP